MQIVTPESLSLYVYISVYTNIRNRGDFEEFDVGLIVFPLIALCGIGCLCGYIPRSRHLATALRAISAPARVRACQVLAPAWL